MILPTSMASGIESKTHIPIQNRMVMPVPPHMLICVCSVPYKFRNEPETYSGCKDAPTLPLLRSGATRVWGVVGNGNRGSLVCAASCAGLIERVQVRPQFRTRDTSLSLNWKHELSRHALFRSIKPKPNLRLRRADAPCERRLATSEVTRAFECFG